MKIALLITALLFAAPVLSAAVYYVDASRPDDSGGGTTLGTAWKTISKVNTTTFQPGDIVRFVKGGLWRDQLEITSSGLQGNPIVFEAYGASGVAIINGSVVVTGATHDSQNQVNRYYKSMLCPPQQVFFNGIRGTNVGGIGNLNTNGEWCYDAPTGRLYYYHNQSPMVEATVYTTALTAVTGATADPNLQHRYYKTFANPSRLFFSKVAGMRVSTLGEVNANGRWYRDDSTGTLYYYYQNNSATVEAAMTSRPHAIKIEANHVVVRGLQVERTDNSAVLISNGTGYSTGVKVDTLAVLQWSDAPVQDQGGIKNSGTNTIIDNCTFGKTTGNHTADQNWAGYIAILSAGVSATISHNQIYHTSTEAGVQAGNASNGIRLSNGTRGTTDVFSNVVFHVGAHGIIANGTRSYTGDRLKIHHNTISYTGQAGISAYQTRLAASQSDVEGHIYDNVVSYANRLGGSVHVNQASGIHFNDGQAASTSEANPFIKWYCYDNVVHHSHSDPNEPGTDGTQTPDSHGIELDYNANGVEVYRNIVYNCDGRGIDIWNASDARVHHNIVWGNDLGLFMARGFSMTDEDCKNNRIEHNTFYKNYNGAGVGSSDNYEAEIVFGQYTANNTIRNNIVYVTSGKYAVKWFTAGSPGNPPDVIDGNLYFSEGTFNFQFNSTSKTYGDWQAAGWDANSPIDNPGFLAGAPNVTTAAASDFTILPNSPALDSGLAGLGYTWDFYKGPIVNGADKGAIELQTLQQTSETSHERLLRWDTQWYHYAQGFRLPTGGSSPVRQAAAVHLLGRKWGTVSGQIWVEIVGDNGSNQPNLSDVKGVSSQLSATNVSTTEGWIEFVFPSAPLLDSGSNYYLVLKGNYTASTANHIRWTFASLTDPYQTDVPGMNAFTVRANGQTDTHVDNDMAFKVYYTY